MKTMLRIVGLLFVLALAACGWLWYEAQVFLNSAPEMPGREIFFDVTPGARLGQVSAALAEKGLVTDARKFSLLARYKQWENRLQAGRFALNSGWTPEQVLDALVNGKPVLFRITVPEGLTWWQTGRLLEEAGLVRFADFRDVVTDPDFLRHYGIPFATNCTALFYNKDIFDAAGMEYPNENTTWEDFHEMAKALTKDGVVGFGNAATGTDEGTFQCLQWLYTAGGDYQNVKGGTDAYNLMQEMVADGSWSKDCVNWTQSDVNNNFVAGNLAMQQNGPWQIPGIEKDAPDLNYGVTVLPKKDAESDQATSILGGENMGAVKQDDMGGATAFMEYYDKTEVMVDAMKQYGSFPPKTEAAQDSYWTDDPIQKEFITQLQTSIPRGPSASWPEYSDALQTGFQEVMTSAKTPEKAAEDTQAAVDKVKASEK